MERPAQAIRPHIYAWPLRRHSAAGCSSSDLDSRLSPFAEYRTLDDDSAGHYLCQRSSGIFKFSDDSFGRHPFKVGAEYCIHPPYPSGRLCRSCDRSFWQCAHPRKLSRWRRRFHYFGDYQLRRYHERCRAYCGGGRSIHTRRDAWKTNGHRCRAQCRNHR